MSKKIKYVTFFLFFTYILICCDGMDATYKEFLKGGEIVYPEKADSLIAYPGDYRIKLSWLIFADPSIVLSKVFWNNKRDSAEISVKRTSGIDTISVLLTGLNEQPYVFEIYNFDDRGNRSVASELITMVYGDNYRNTLFNRLIKKLSIVESHLLIEWDNAEEHVIGQEVVYLDKNGKIQTDFINSRETTTLLENYDMTQQQIAYRTLFQPTSLALDTFKTDLQTIEYEIKLSEVNRNDFALVDLPGDENSANSATNSIDRIWTNDYSIDATPFISKAWSLNQCDELVPFPYWFTIDLGQEYDLISITLFQRGGAHVYNNNNLKKFEIWGALEIDELYNPKDHGGIFDDNWVLLNECEIIRPDDQSAWLTEASKGHMFDLQINNKPSKIKYLRIKAIDNWLPETGPCEIVKKRTYINIASMRLEALQVLF